MKRCRAVNILMTVCMIIGLALVPANQINVQAAEVIATVSGTIRSGTTSDLLKLSTKEGNMEIKLDSDTDTSAFKLLLPGKKIFVSVSHGSDGYLHAVKITGQEPSSTASIDSSNTTTVTGTLGEKSTDEIIYFNTAQGEMQIKLDTTTNMSGCSVLVMGKTYYITCARGSDAYMHAISISDNSNAAASTTTSSTSSNNAATTSITGTVAKKTKEDVLYLSTSGGEMQFKIDSNADTINGMINTPGTKLTVSFYHGSDAYLHATAIVGVKDSASSAEISTSTVTVEGTVKSKSTQNILYLSTKQGDMEIKLDKVNSLNNCKVLISGKKVSVTIAHGSDAYMHAIDITGLQEAVNFFVSGEL